MSYKALLFCPEEKTARVVTQVLTELEFQVEPCNEPFAAVKKLMAEHFDAVVVDCENEQNATLLFRSAKNSGSNQTALSVAVVEGQSGVAKAFRIGANLVLTKPINVEQSKGTLRVARGLLRKTDGSKTGTFPAISESHPMPSPVVAPSLSSPKPPVPSVSEAPKMPAFTPAPPAPPAPVASAGSQFELEAEPEVKLGPTEAALLESMPDPLAGKASVEQPSSKPSRWQPASKAMAEPMASALQHASDAATEPSASAAARNNSISATPASRPVLVSTHGTAAAAAPAKARTEIEETTPEEIEPPAFSSSIGQRPASESGAGRKIVAIAVIVLVVAAAGYFGWKNKAQLGALTSLLHKPAVQAPAAAAIKPAATQPSAVPTTLAPPYSAEVVATPAPAVPEKTPAAVPPALAPATTAPATTAPVAAAPAPKKSTPTPKTAAESPAPVKTIADDGTTDALVVKGNSATPVTQTPPPQEVAETNAPEATSIVSGSDSGAVSGLVSLPAGTPQAAPQTLKVSQGVSQGLLIKKVAPVYPPQALRMGVQGAVQLSAHISKSGDITNIEVLSGDQMLSQAAVDAVKQWKYKPYYLDSQPVEIQTQITVNFKLP